MPFKNWWSRLSLQRPHSYWLQNKEDITNELRLYKFIHCSIFLYNEFLNSYFPAAKLKAWSTESVKFSTIYIFTNLVKLSWKIGWKISPSWLTWALWYNYRLLITLLKWRYWIQAVGGAKKSEWKCWQWLYKKFQAKESLLISLPAISVYCVFCESAKRLEGSSQVFRLTLSGWQVDW